MAYDIPPQLRHKEKIAFSLTFIQLAYAGPALLIISFLLFKSGLHLFISITFSSMIAVLATVFMFFEGKEKLFSFVKHFRNREVEVNSQKLKKLIDIKKIDKAIVYTSKKKLTVLEITPLNFMIKSETNKDAIIKGFQKFLNSLDYPIQIHISTSTISLREHLKHLEKKTKNLFELFDSYCKFIKDCITINKVKNRKFYIIIEEKDDINIQTKVCEEKLKSLGLKVKRLQNKALLKLYFDYVANKTKKELKEDQTVEDYTHFLLSPEKVTFYHDFFKINGNYCKVLSVRGYPQSVETGFLDKIISSGDDYDISIHIEPYPVDLTMIQLNKDLQKQQSDLYTDTQKGIINPSLEIKYKSTRKTLEELQKGQQKLFNTSLYIMCKGESKKQAELLSKKIKSELEGLMIQSKIPIFQMIDSYESMIPLAKDSLKIKRNIPTSGLSAFFPFSSPFLDIDPKGILLGLNKNKIPYIKDIFKLTNANGIILATSGSGKSYFTKLLLSRQYMNGCDIFIIDPQGEYIGITKQYGGETITISKDSKTMINPLDLMGHDYLEKRLSLMDLFQIMFGELTEIQKAILDKAVDETYGRKKINRDSWKGKEPPIMQDLYQVLINLERRCATQEKVTYRALLNRLAMYTENGVFSFLNKHTNIDFNKNFVCFNIGDMPKQVKPTIMYLVLDFVYMQMKNTLKRKLLIIDEAWSLLQTAEESSYVFEIVKTCRKYNLGLLMITQDVADLVGSKAGHAVLANTSYTFLLRQKPAVIQNIARTFHLSKAEKDYLITAEKGKGILILENEHQELEVIASPKEHEIITTNPDEILKNKKTNKPQKEKSTIITLNIQQDVHPAWNKTQEEKNFLANNKYILGIFHNFEKGKQKEYLIKKRHPESPLHTYYTDLIFQEIRKHTKKVKKYRTEKPDIIFTNKKGELIAIEIETGIGINKKKKYHNQKFPQLKKQYGDNCYIFIVTSLLKNSYARHKLPILTRNNTIEFVKSQLSNKHNSTIVPKTDLTKDKKQAHKA